MSQDWGVPGLHQYPETELPNNSIIFMKTPMMIILWNKKKIEVYDLMNILGIQAGGIIPKSMIMIKLTVIYGLNKLLFSATPRSKHTERIEK